MQPLREAAKYLQLAQKQSRAYDGNLQINVAEEIGAEQKTQASKPDIGSISEHI